MQNILKNSKDSALTVPDNLSDRDGRAVWREEGNASVTVIIFFPSLLHEKTSFIWLTEYRVSSSHRIAAEQSTDVTRRCRAAEPAPRPTRTGCTHFAHEWQTAVWVRKGTVNGTTQEVQKKESKMNRGRT